MRGVLAAVVGALVFVGGAWAEPPVRDDEAGWWEARLHIDEPHGPDSRAAIEFDLWLPPVGDDRPAYIRNGVEFIEAEFERNQNEHVIRFPHYDSRIEAELVSVDSGQQLLEGTWVKARSDGFASMKFSATSRFDGFPRNPIEVHERWEMSFDKSGQALGVFRYADGSEADIVGCFAGLEGDETGYDSYGRTLYGTILTPTGDYRYLAGRVGFVSVDRENYSRPSMTPERYTLSVFDGAHAFLFTADVDPDSGDLTNGHFYSGNHWHETFTARRLAEGEEFELADPFSEVSLKPGVTRLGLPKLNEAPYAGKPVIVQVMGTWCPNCHDEAPVLADLYQKHRADGLQILSLCYEYTDDAERSARQIERFKERHGAAWEFVAAGVNDKQKTAATLPALSAIKSYPTTIWINPDGTVRAIHSGFSGPATGEKHEETLREFERLTREIVEAR